MKRLAAGLVLQGVWLASPVLLPAQQRVDPRTPEAVLEAFFAALDAQQWREAVELLEPTDLDVFRRGMARRLREPSPPDLTVEDFLRGDPNMPRVVAEYQHKQYLQNRGTLQEFLSERFAGVRNADELDSLPIEELAVRWLQAQHPVAELLTQLKGKGCPIPEGITRGLRAVSLRSVRSPRRILQPRSGGGCPEAHGARLAYPSPCRPDKCP